MYGIKQEDDLEHFEEISDTCSKHFNIKFFGTHSREIFFDVNGSIFWFPKLPVFRDLILSTLFIFYVHEKEELDHL